MEEINLSQPRDEVSISYEDFKKKYGESLVKASNDSPIRINAQLGILEPLLNLPEAAAHYSIPNMLLQATGAIQDKDIPDLSKVSTLRNIDAVKEYESELLARDTVSGELLNEGGITSSALRYAPEIVAGLKIPMSAYAKTLRVGDSVLPAGPIVGAGEMSTYSIGRNGYDNLEGTLTHGGIGGVMGYALGRLAPPIKYKKSDYERNKFTSNSEANKEVADNTMGVVPLAVTGGVALSSMPSDTDASILSNVAKMFSPKSEVPLSTQEAARIIKRSDKIHANKHESAYETEASTLTNLSEFQVKNTDGLIEDIVNTQKQEFSRYSQANQQMTNEIDDILSKSTYETKTLPNALETNLHRIVNDELPLVNKENKFSRDTLGKMYRSGMDENDIYAISKDFDALSKESESLTYGMKKTDVLKLDNIAENIASHIIDNTNKIKYSKNPETALLKVGLDANTDTIRALELLIKDKYIKAQDKETLDEFYKLIESKPTTVNDIFATRSQVNLKTQDLIDSGSILKEDVAFGYVSPKYENQMIAKSVTPDEYDQLLKLDEKYSAWNKVNPLGDKKNNSIFLDKANYYKNSQGDTMVEVKIKKLSDDFVQGSLPMQSKEMSGYSTVLAGRTKEVIPASGLVNGIIDRQVVFNGSTVKTQVNGKANKVLFSIKDNKGNQIGVTKVMSYRDYIKNIDLAEKTFGKDIQDSSIVLDVIRPLDNEMKAKLGLSDDIADVAGKTISSVQKNLAKENMYRDIRTKNTTMLTEDNVMEIITSKSIQPKTMFLGIKDLRLLNKPEVLQYLSNNYLKIDDLNVAKATNSRYVSKEYANDMFGFYKMFATEGEFSTGRMVENLMMTGNQWFRTSVVIKNTVSLVNNSLGMMFTNFAEMYMKYGVMSSKPFSGFVESGMNYKTFIQDRYDLFQAELRGDFLSVNSIKEKLEANPAYQLYKEGGLQSMLDDALLSKTFKESGDSSQAFELSVRALRNVLLTEGSTTGNVARSLADYSDIANRINLYTMLRAQGLSSKEAARETTATSVNYTRLLSPSMMYARDIGAMPFITWYSRMLPKMVDLIRNNPIAFAKLQGFYLAMQGVLGSQNFYGDDYIGGIRVEGWWAPNALAPTNIGDVVGGPISSVMSGEAPAVIPQVLKHVYDGRIDKLAGFTTN